VTFIIFKVSAFYPEKSKLKIFKVSVRNHCPKDCVVLLCIFKLAICDMIKKKEKGSVVIRNGNHTDLTCSKVWISPSAPRAHF
jgi:hypothetical protein